MAYLRRAASDLREQGLYFVHCSMEVDLHSGQPQFSPVCGPLLLQFNGGGSAADRLSFRCGYLIAIDIAAFRCPRRNCYG